MITNTIITLYEFTSKVETQFIFFTDSVRCQHRYPWLPTRTSYLKGIEKILENRSVLQNAL